VVAAVAVFHPDRLIGGIDDSKKVPERRREELLPIILEGAVDFGIGLSRQDEIDAINILQATRLAMLRAIAHLRNPPDCLLVDGMSLPDIGIHQDAVIRGDGRCRCIAGASIVAKVIRDRIMRAFDLRYPGYGFSRNKGYPTREHLTAIERLGILPIHRKSYAPVRRYIEERSGTRGV
jgi:ribonuclease HII